MVTHQSMNPAEMDLTLLDETWCCPSGIMTRSMLNTFVFNFLSWEKVAARKNHWYWLGKKRKKKMTGMKMRIITWFGVWTRSGTFFIVILVLRKRITQFTDWYLAECFQQCYISWWILLLLLFALFFYNACSLWL